MDDKFTEDEIEALLARVKQVNIPIGFADRLQAKLQVEAPSNVIAFPNRKMPPPVTSSRRVWLSAIPLAASLAFGIYVGTMGELPESFAGLEGTLISASGDNLFTTGIEDTESFLNGDLS